MLVSRGDFDAFHDSHGIGRSVSDRRCHTDPGRPGAEPGAARRSTTLMATPFPTDLVAAPAAGRLAWVSSQSGVNNIWISEPPAHKARAVTTYASDDGQWITEVGWTSDAKTIVYVRGDGPNRQGESPNPAQLQDGTEQAVFAVAVDGGAPRRLGPGSGPAASPQGQRVAWVSRGQIWSVDLSAADKAAQLVNARGTASGLAWSPDGSMLAFTSNRGTHSYIGVFTLASRELRYVDPSLDRDGSAGVVRRWRQHRLDPSGGRAAAAPVLAATHRGRALVDPRGEREVW